MKPQREAIATAHQWETLGQVYARLRRERRTGVTVQSEGSAVGHRRSDLLLHRAPAKAAGATVTCNRSLVYMGPRQQQVGVSLPTDTARFQRHDHMAVDRVGVKTSKPMTSKHVTAEQASAQLTLLTPEDIEGALGEVQRELQVRERCYPRWVEEGKMSRIYAKDRMERQIIAEKLLTLLLDSAAKAA